MEQLNQTIQLIAYHGDPAIKLKYQQRFAAHRAADQVVQGIGFDKGRGCFVGCTLDNYEHHLFPVELGWPEWLAHLADAIFEGLPAEDAPQFGTDLLEAVPVGTDLEPVKWAFGLALLEQIKSNPKVSEGDDRESTVQELVERAIAFVKMKLLNVYADDEAKKLRDLAFNASMGLNAPTCDATRIAHYAVSCIWFLARGHLRHMAYFAADAARCACSIAAIGSADELDYAWWQQTRITLLTLVRSAPQASK
jgi:hypothetical protein